MSRALGSSSSDTKSPYPRGVLTGAPCASRCVTEQTKNWGTFLGLSRPIKKDLIWYVLCFMGIYIKVGPGSWKVSELMMNVQERENEAFKRWSGGGKKVRTTSSTIHIQCSKREEFNIEEPQCTFTEARGKMRSMGFIFNYLMELISKTSAQAM